MDARYVPRDSATQAQCIVVRPNRSLSLRGMIWLFVAYAGLISIIGFGFFWVGAWMVLPFAGLEAVVIAAIFYYAVYRHIDDHELIMLDGDTLTIIKHRGKSQSRLDFQRYWTTVKLQRGGHHWHPSRLLLGSHGRFVEIGASIREEHRQVLASRLRRMMGQTAYT
jgi:uncharacterized membrane protein